MSWNGWLRRPLHDPECGEGLRCQHTNMTSRCRDFGAAHLVCTITEHEVLFRRIRVQDLQCAWLLLHCTASKARYLLRVLPPQWSAVFATAHDQGLFCSRPCGSDVHVGTVCGSCSNVPLDQVTPSRLLRRYSLCLVGCLCSAVRTSPP